MPRLSSLWVITESDQSATTVLLLTSTDHRGTMRESFANERLPTTGLIHLPFIRMSESKNVAEAIANVLHRELADTESRLETKMTTAIAQSEQRTTERFAAELAATEQRITSKLTKEIQEATEPHFKAINDDLLLIEKKLDNVLTILQDGARLDELERRVGKLAELAGLPEFTQPIRRPIGA